MHFWLLWHLRNFSMDRFFAQGYGKLYMLVYMLGYSWFLLWGHFLFPSQLLNISAQITALNFTFSVWFWGLNSSLSQNVPIRIVALGSKTNKQKTDVRYCSSVACYHKLIYGRRGTDQKIKCLWCWRFWLVLRAFSIFFLNKGRIFPLDFERHTTGCFTCWKVCPLLRPIWCNKAGISVSTLLTAFPK